MANKKKPEKEKKIRCTFSIGKEEKEKLSYLSKIQNFESDSFTLREMIKEEFERHKDIN